MKIEITIDEFAIKQFILPLGTPPQKGFPATLISSDGTKLEGYMRSVPLTKLTGIPEKLAGFYVIINYMLGGFYVGSTSCLCRRRSLHSRRLLRGIHFNPKLSEAFKSDIPTHFEFRYFYIERPTENVREVLYQLEQEVLDKYLDKPVCWNIGSDTRAAWKGRSPSAQTRQLISSKLTGKPKSPEARKNMSLSHIGQIASAKSIEAHRKATSRGVYINGKAYRSIREAAELLNLGLSTIVRHANSSDPEWSNWNYVDQLWDI